MSDAGPSISDALGAMRGRTALIVGDLMLDAYVYGETQRVSREAPVLVVRQQNVVHKLGGAANTAANLCALGLHTIVVSSIGQDAAGDTLRTLLDEVGCDTSHLISTPRPTPVKTRILAGALGTHKQQVLRLDNVDEAALSDETLAMLSKTLTTLAAKSHVVVVSDYGLGNVVGPVVAEVRNLADAGHTVCVDSRFCVRDFAGVTAITPNMPEAEEALGFGLHDDKALLAGGASLLESLGVQACLITQGKMGMTLFAKDAQPMHVKVVGNSEVTDVTGAGDSVIATLSAALAADVGLVNGMLLANCAAGVVVTRQGTATASPTDIMQAADAGHVRLIAHMANGTHPIA